MLPLPTQAATNSMNSNYSLKNNFTEMKKLRFLSAALLSASMVCLLTACPSATGEVGPIGPKGEKGDKGDTGAQGPAGTANVIYGGWINMDVAGFWYNVGSNIREANFAAPIDQNILDKGTVYVYAKGTAAGNVYLLPYNPSQNLAMQYFFKLNRVHIQQIFYSAGRPAAYSNQGFTEFRYVVIPGGVNGRKAAIDYSNYEEVKKAYNLPD